MWTIKALHLHESHHIALNALVLPTSLPFCCHPCSHHSPQNLVAELPKRTPEQSLSPHHRPPPGSLPARRRERPQPHPCCKVDELVTSVRGSHFVWISISIFSRSAPLNQLLHAVIRIESGSNIRYHGVVILRIERRTESRKRLSKLWGSEILFEKLLRLLALW